MLQKNVIADRIDKGPKTVRLAQSISLRRVENTLRKRLLAHVLNGLGRLEPRTKFQMEQFGKITDKMLLGSQIPGAQILDVACIE